MTSAASALVCGQALFGGLTSANASETAQPDTALDVIVVTAQKRSENIQDVPIAITALSAKDIENRGIKNLTDLAQQVPGFLYGDIAGAPQIFVRGVGFNTLSGAGESSIATNIDGVYIEHTGAVGMMQYDLGQIEVLRGPQGTLYGHNATGGAINLYSTEPSADFHTGAKVSYGNYDASQESAYVTGALTDSVRARAFVENDKRDGYITNLAPAGVGSSTYDGSSGTMGRISIDADLSENVGLKLRIFDRREDFSGPFYKPSNPQFFSDVIGLPVSALGAITSFSPWSSKTDTPNASTRTLTGASARFDATLGNFQLVSITSYTNYRLDEKVEDGEGTLLPIYEIAPREDKATTFQQELDLLYAGPQTKATMGVYYMHDVDNFFAYVMGPFDFSNVSFNSSHQVFDNASIFGDVTQNINDQLSIYGGLRGIYEHFKFQHDDFDGPVSALGAPVPALSPGNSGTPLTNLWGCNFAGQGNDSAFAPTWGAAGDQSSSRTTATGRIGAIHQFSAQSNVYAQYSQGDKSEVYDNSSCTPPTKPERLIAYEVGSKNVLLDGTVQLNGAAYYYDYHDLQVESIALPEILYQSADARIYGAEVEAKWAPERQLSFDLGVNLMSAKYTNFTSADFLNAVVPGYDTNTNQDGHYLNRSPVYTVSLDAEYDVPVGFGTFKFNGDAYASGSYYLRAYNLPADRQAAYAMFGGSVTFVPTHSFWQVRAFVKNASDRAYILGMVASLPGQESIYGAPRTFGAEVSVDF